MGINAEVGSLKACWCLEYLEGYGCIYAGCTDVAISEAILHAKDNGYHVINMSLGGPDSDILRSAVEQALAAGMVLVASAGNSYEYNDISMSYPAAYPGVVAVAATDHYDNLASFSNFGSWVDVAAPGTNILSAYPSAGCGGAENCYSWMSGTSMASPIVAGAAALVLDKISGSSLEMSTNLRDDVIAAIRSNADHTGAIGQNMLAWTQYGRLNLHAALTGPCTDADEDGFCVDGNDCDDSDASINPNAAELCEDNIDNDCDNTIDNNDSDCIATICSSIQEKKACNVETACRWDNRQKICVEN